MSEKPVARLGDPGSHGGTIVSAAPEVIVNGRPMARVGDIYACPRHGKNPIVTGAPDVFGQGRSVAHVGSKTACGAVITAGSPDTFVDAPASAAAMPVSVESFSEFFILTDDQGNPAENIKYRLTAASGHVLEGVTGSDGKTERIFTEQAEQVTMEIVLDELTPYGNAG